MPAPSGYNNAMHDRRRFIGLPAVPVLLLAAGIPVLAIAAAQTAGSPRPAEPPPTREAENSQPDPQQEFKTGADLTRRGLLQEAIPHLLAAQQAGLDPYATGVNLGICYVGTGAYKPAIAVLTPLRTQQLRTPVIDNLLAQAYLGDGQRHAAFEEFLRAAALSPKDETLYAFIADACNDHQDFALGLAMMDRGLVQLPESARLHYERAVFLGRLGRFEEAKPDFDRAAQLAPDSYIGYLARVQKDLYEDDLVDATRLLHQAIAAGQRDYRMLSLLGTVLLHDGAAPGEPQFAEAQSALEESAKQRPDYPATQIALGKLYLMEGRYRDAVEHLEIGRKLEPENPAVYTSLAEAWGRLGDREKARQMREQIGRLLAEKKSNTDPSQP